MSGHVVVIGAGITGLAAAQVSGACVYEAEEWPGGICSSYYVRPGDSLRYHQVQGDQEVYRFEIGGGHWIFGADVLVQRFLRSLATINLYERKSAIFFPDQGLFVPYPIQHHLRCLGEEVACKALTEMLLDRPKTSPMTMQDWLYATFGRTLTEMFFAPFHELYTAGLWSKIAPQDPHKSPVVPALAIRGAFEQTPLVGYNATFLYPKEGLDVLARRLAERCHVYYNKRVVQIDVRGKEILFADGSGARYELLISTLPLNTMMEMTGLYIDEQPDPYTSVLVLNLGAERGPKCPDEHWIYLPHTRAGFYRVGFYSNVDSAFLPASARETNNLVSMYIERAFIGGSRPSPEVTKNYMAQVIEELQGWGWIGKVEVADVTWIDVAYTWSWPGSRWREKALTLLEKYDIIQAGRYGQWVFQGIMESVKEGMVTGSLLRGA